MAFSYTGIPFTFLVDWAANSGIYPHAFRLATATVSVQIALGGLPSNVTYPWFNTPQFILQAIAAIQQRAAEDWQYRALIVEAGGQTILDIPPMPNYDETPPQAYPPF